MDYTPKDLTEIICHDQEIEGVAQQIVNHTNGSRIEQYIFGTTGIMTTNEVFQAMETEEEHFHVKETSMKH